jgi:hypothetical protein
MVLLVGGVLHTQAAAQDDRGYISGFVKNSRGTPLGGVLVTVLQGTFNPRVVQRVTTNGFGHFEIKNLSPGSYALSASLASYLPMLKSGIEVAAGKMERLNLSLQNLYLQTLSPGAPGDPSSAPQEDIGSVLRMASSTRPILRFQGTGHQGADLKLDLESPRASAQADQGWHGSVHVYSTAYSADPDLLDLGGAFTEFVFVKDLNSNSRWLMAGTVSESGYTELDSLIRWKDLNGHNPSLRLSLGSFPYLDRQVPSEKGHLQRLNLFNLDFQDEVAISEMLSAIYGVELQATDPSVKARRVRPRWGLRMRPHPGYQVAFIRTRSMPRHYRAAPSRSGEELSYSSPFLHPFGSKMRLGRTEATHTEMTVDHELGNGSLLAVGVYSDEFSPGRAWAAAGSPSIVPASSKGVRVAYGRPLGHGVHTDLGYTFGGGTQWGQGAFDLTPRNYHVMVARLKAQADSSGTRVAATYRYISGVSLTVIDPYQEYFESSAPGLNLMVTQSIPYVGRFIPGELEAQLDVHNLFDQHRFDLTDAAGEPRHSEFLQTPRSLRGGIRLKF